MKGLERELSVYELYMEALEKIEDYHAWKDGDKAYPMQCADELRKYFDGRLDVRAENFGKSLAFHPIEARNKHVDSFRLWVAANNGNGEMYDKQGLLGEVYKRKKSLAKKMLELRDMVENYNKYMSMNRDFAKAYEKYKSKVPARLQAFTVTTMHSDFVSEL